DYLLTLLPKDVDAGLLAVHVLFRQKIAILNQFVNFLALLSPDLIDAMDSNCLLQSCLEAIYPPNVPLFKVNMLAEVSDISELCLIDDGEADGMNVLENDADVVKDEEEEEDEVFYSEAEEGEEVLHN